MTSLTIPYYHVDSFTNVVFTGNPAGICILDNFPPDSVLQNIAGENRHSQTAFVMPRADGDFNLRWFSPVIEDELCGHATLAAAHVLVLRKHETWPVKFHTRSGILTVSRQQELYEMDFPIWPAQICENAPSFLLEALGIEKALVMITPRDFMVVVESSSQVEALTPDIKSLASLEDNRGVIVTAPGIDDVDYVARYFAPSIGIDEDPVTGSINCSMAPYWADRLGKTSLRVQQLSRRGGQMRCVIAGDRVLISGTAHLYFSGTIMLDV
ncbi:MAG: PhzF family phenazine biosynthesis protein [Steroidobacter sp.]